MFKKYKKKVTFSNWYIKKIKKLIKQKFLIYLPLLHDHTILETVICKGILIHDEIHPYVHWKPFSNFFEMVLLTFSLKV